MNTAGIVLCGGHSSRMGRPKAWLPFGDELMLPRIVRILCEAVDPVVVVAAADQDLPPLPPDVLVARDAVADRGPLQGLAAGLTALDGLADAAYLSSCDVPFLRPAFIRRVVDLLGESRIAIPHVGGFYHPLAAAYRLDVLPEVRELLAADRLKPTLLLETVAARIVEPHELTDIDPDLASLRNLNTPDDYAAALRTLAE
ncbi:MAG TPA: molybdenum cofactor guanylyltransferase [Gemmataceae bacterium]